MHDNPYETLPAVDEQGRTIGTISRQHAHGGSMVLHPVVHLHLFNPKGHLCLQQRPLWKDVQPGKWDTATGGHVAMGETIMQALRREVAEELGISHYEPTLMARYVFQSDVERELIHVFTTTYSGAIHPNTLELRQARFWTKDEIAEAMGKGVFTPNFEHEYQLFFACK